MQTYLSLPFMPCRLSAPLPYAPPALSLFVCNCHRLLILVHCIRRPPPFYLRLWWDTQNRDVRNTWFGRHLALLWGARSLPGHTSTRSTATASLLLPWRLAVKRPSLRLPRWRWLPLPPFPSTRFSAFTGRISTAPLCLIGGFQVGSEKMQAVVFLVAGAPVFAPRVRRTLICLGFTIFSCVSLNVWLILSESELLRVKWRLTSTLWGWKVKYRHVCKVRNRLPGASQPLPPLPPPASPPAWPWMPRARASRCLAIACV